MNLYYNYKGFEKDMNNIKDNYSVNNEFFDLLEMYCNEHDYALVRCEHE